MFTLHRNDSQYTEFKEHRASRLKRYIINISVGVFPTAHLFAFLQKVKLRFKEVRDMS